MDIKEYFPCDNGEEKKLFFTCENTKEIYNHMEDAISKEIFANRLLYSQTGDYQYIRNIVLGTPVGKQLCDLLEGPLYIYGAGRRGKSLLETFPDKDWRGFIDKNKCGEYIGYPVLKYDEFEYKPGRKIVLSNKYEYEPILQDLIEDKQIDKSNILILEEYSKLASKDIYFERRCLGNFQIYGGSFLDIGCYDGTDTINAMRAFPDEKFPILAIEPDSSNFEVCRNNLSNYGNVSVYRKGVSARTEVGRFSDSGKPGARFTEDGTELVELDTIDNIVGDNKVNYIKMDIEGYEEQALQGAASTIMRWKPALAICVYHKKSDIWRLPLKILELNEDYRFFMGHYTLSWGDSVVYAVDKSCL